MELTRVYVATHLNVDVLRMSRVLAEALMNSSEPVGKVGENEATLAVRKAQWWAEAEARFRLLKADALLNAI